MVPRCCDDSMRLGTGQKQPRGCRTGSMCRRAADRAGRRVDREETGASVSGRHRDGRRWRLNRGEVDGRRARRVLGTGGEGKKRKRRTG